MSAKFVLTINLLSISLAVIAWFRKEEMAMGEYRQMIMARQVSALWDLRDLPLARLKEQAEAKQLVKVVMEGKDGSSLVVVSSFNSAI
jgi:hypothetical protein